MTTRSKPLERYWRISEEGANCVKGTKEFRKLLGKLKARSKPLELQNFSRSKPIESNSIIWKETIKL